jgi:abortive infection bacteriophage resistance protein
MGQQYNKPALSINELLGLISSKNIVIHDFQKAAQRLKTVSYHRLLPYLECLSKTNHDFVESSFDAAWGLYYFDRKLRFLMNDAIERIEVAFRTSLSETMSWKYSPYWFLEKKLFSNKQKYTGFIEQVNNACKDRHNAYIQEYYSKYDSPKYPPSWVLFECLSFGACISVFCNIKQLKDRKSICAIFNEHPTTMQSWLYAMRYVRNLCAHHSRIWNRWFVVTPALTFLLGKNFNKNNTCYAQLIVLERLLNNLDHEHSWKLELKALLLNHEKLPIHEMGFELNWQNDPFWSK